MELDLLEETQAHALSLSGIIKSDILDPLFPKQTECINHPAKLKAIWCTRRAAKSYTDGLGLVKTALENPGCNVLYIGLSRLQAKGIMWKDVLLDINKRHRLECTPNLTELSLTYSNGSVVYLTGVDATEDQMQKLLGKKWKLVIIDEAQSFTIDMRTLVYGILKPTTVDLDGSIWLSGTSGNLTQGLFFDITNGVEPGWTIFSWSALDNPYVKNQWQAELDDIEKNRPLFKQTSLYKQWYLNEWVIDEEAKVYKYSSKNLVMHLPNDLMGWQYVLGIDLAHSPDSTSFVIGAYTEGHNVLYLIYAFKALKMDITDVALHIHLLERTYKFNVKVCDGANKQAVAELNNRHNLNLISTEKTEKADFIKLMNDDFIQKKIMLLSEETKCLQQEYSKLIWLTDPNGKVKEPRKEDPSIHNDTCDSALYLWRYCYNYLKVWEFQKTWINPHDQRQWEPAHVARLEDQIRRDQKPHTHLDLEWNEAWDRQEEELNDYLQP